MNTHTLGPETHRTCSSVIMRGAEPFLFPGDSTGCLLLHGFTGTPFEMRGLGEFLADQGFTVLAPRLFGHATKQEDMPRARRQDWLASAEDGYRLLAGCCELIMPIGLSMGGALALLLAASLPVVGAAALSTPYHPPDPRMRPLRPVAGLVSRIWPFAGKGPGDFADPAAAATHLEYSDYPVRAAAELFDVIEQQRRVLPTVTCPVLVVHSRRDQSVPFSDAQALLADIGSQDKTLCWVDRSGHVVTRDADRFSVFDALQTFVRRCARIGV
jgi:carboxylesterase